MPKESFLLLSLSDSKAKKVAQVVSNESCKKILEYLAHTKSATETRIANDLSLPISTVHYNLKQLVDVKLVDADEFHYSSKGKEVIHYTLANKYIIIAPKESESMKEKLRKLLPAFGVVLAGSIIIKIVQLLNSQKLMASSAEKISLDNGAPSLMAAAQEQTVNSFSINPGFAAWFFIGGMIAILSYLLIDWINKK